MRCQNNFANSAIVGGALPTVTEVSIMSKTFLAAISSVVLFGVTNSSYAETYCSPGPSGQMWCTHAQSTRPLPYSEPNPHGSQVILHGGWAAASGAGAISHGSRGSPYAGVVADSAYRHGVMAGDAYRNYRQFKPSPNWPGRAYYRR